MAEYRFPTPGSYQRRKLDFLARLEGYEFEEEDAVNDIMLAMDRDDIKPIRYYAKRWGWNRGRVFRSMPRLKETAELWRDFRSIPPRKEVGQERDKSVTKNAGKSTIKATSGTRVGQERDSIEQTHTHTIKNNTLKTETNLTGVVGQKRFSRPSIDDISGYLRTYAESKNLIVDCREVAEKIHDHYSANGWKVGRNAMKDWKAAARNWLRRDLEGGSLSKKNKPRQETYQPRSTYITPEARNGAAKLSDLYGFLDEPKA